MESAKFTPLTKPPTTSSTPITVSERAASELKTALAAEKVGSYAGLRLGVDAGGCCGAGYSLAFAKQSEPGDIVVEAEGVRLFVSASDAKALAGAKVDFVDTPMGSGFHIDNPNVAAGHGGHGHGHGGGGCGGNCACAEGERGESGCGC